jgi:hypothetical protein
MTDTSVIADMLLEMVFDGVGAAAPQAVKLVAASRDNKARYFMECSSFSYTFTSTATNREKSNAIWIAFLLLHLEGIDVHLTFQITL